MGRPRRFGGYPPAYRLGLTKEDAAAYVGASLKEFELLVAAGEMPQPKMLGETRRWSRIDLELAFAVLPESLPECTVVEGESFPASAILVLERNTDAAAKLCDYYDSDSPEWITACKNYQKQLQLEKDAKKPHYEDEVVACERLGVDKKEFGKLIRKTAGYDRINIDFRYWVPKMCVAQVELAIRKIEPT